MWKKSWIAYAQKPGSRRPLGKNKKKRHVYPDVPEPLPFEIVDNHTHLPVRGDSYADDEASLAERSGSLFDWCRGFLGGFGLSAGANPPLSEEGSETLFDLAKLAAAAPQDDGDEEDEAALVEIAEFIRVAALLLHGDCVLGPRHRRSMH